MDKWLMPGIPRTVADEPDMETVERIRASVTSDTGQVVESDMLLDCPFCGGRPWIGVHELDETCVEARVVCGGCHVSTSREHQGWKVSYMGDDLTRTLAIGRAISAWNRRAERTCNVESSHVEWERGDYSYLEVELSCGHAFTWDDGTPPDYCPYCGARLVGPHEA